MTDNQKNYTEETLKKINTLFSKEELDQKLQDIFDREMANLDTFYKNHLKDEFQRKLRYSIDGNNSDLVDKLVNHKFTELMENKFEDILAIKLNQRIEKFVYDVINRKSSEIVDMVEKYIKDEISIVSSERLTDLEEKEEKLEDLENRI
jgi:hypothetical protein